MPSRIKSVANEMLASKKFLAALAGILTWSVGRAGFDVDPETLAPVLGMLGAYVVGQGVADLGKEAKKHSGAMAREGLRDGLQTAKVIVERQADKHLSDEIKKAMLESTLKDLDEAADSALAWSPKGGWPKAPKGFETK